MKILKIKLLYELKVGKKGTSKKTIYRLSDTKHKKIFQSRMSPSGFVSMIANFNEAQTKAIQDMGFGGFLHLQVTELSEIYANG